MLATAMLGHWNCCSFVIVSLGLPLQLHCHECQDCAWKVAQLTLEQ